MDAVKTRLKLAAARLKAIEQAFNAGRNDIARVKSVRRDIQIALLYLDNPGIIINESKCVIDSDD